MERQNYVRLTNVSLADPAERLGYCYCDLYGNHACPQPIYANEPPKMIIKTEDVMMNLTSWNITAWILDTEKQYRKVREKPFGIEKSLP